MTKKLANMKSAKKTKVEKIWDFEFVIEDENGQQGGAYPGTMTEAIRAYEADIKNPGVISMVLYRNGRKIRHYTRLQ